MIKPDIFIFIAIKKLDYQMQFVKTLKYDQITGCLLKLRHSKLKKS
jgi:hypothetical protein